MGIIYEEYIKAIDQRDIEVSDTMRDFGNNVAISLQGKCTMKEVIERVDGYILSIKEDISMNKYALDANMISGRKAKFKRTLKRLDEEATVLNMKLKKLEEEYTMWKQLKKEIEDGKYNFK